MALISLFFGQLLQKLDMWFFVLVSSLLLDNLIDCCLFPLLRKREYSSHVYFLSDFHDLIDLYCITSAVWVSLVVLLLPSLKKKN